MKKNIVSEFQFPPLKKNDKVLVTVGKDRGKSGKIIKVDRDHHRVFVENINMMKKAIKPNQTSPQGGFIEKENFINASNVMIECPHCQKPTRIAHKLLENGKKVRACKKCKELIDQK
jgi:large subunit ribosomal protein L24